MPTEEQAAPWTEISDFVRDPSLWLDTSSDRFGGHLPRLEKGRIFLHNLVQAVKHGR